MKCQAGWITNCNQYCQEKYQQHQIHSWHHSNGRKWRETKVPLHEGERTGLKCSFKKIMIFASGPNTSRQRERGKEDAVTDFILGYSKITVDDDCSHEIKTCLLLGSKAMINQHSVLKSRNIILPMKVRIVKAMIFSSIHVQMWELNHKEVWGLKNWCFWTVVLGKTLECPLNCKGIKPVDPKGNNPEYSLEGLMPHWKWPF